MRDILLLVGLSSSGKDYLSKCLVSNYGFNNMVSYTTRPPRKGEQDGVEYHFINTNQEFYELVEQGEIFEMTEYETVHGLWLYGYGKKSLPERGKYKNVAIVNPHGVEQFLKSEIADRVCIIDIHADYGDRLNQVCERYGGIKEMTEGQMAEAFRREVEDNEPFKDYLKDPENKWSPLLKGVPNRNWFNKYDSQSLANGLEIIKYLMGGLYV